MNAKTPLYIALVVFGLIGAWLVTDAVLYVPDGRGSKVGISPPRVFFGAPPPIGMPPESERSTPAQIERITRIASDQRLLGVGSVEGIVDRRDWRAVSGACVEALARRGDQLRRQPLLMHDTPNMPEADTCRAADNTHLIGMTTNDLRNPRVRARQFRLHFHPAGAWLTHDVRQACEAWLRPQRLNLEPDATGENRRLWCG